MGGCLPSHAPEWAAVGERAAFPGSMDIPDAIGKTSLVQLRDVVPPGCDGIRWVATDEAQAMTRRLARAEGLFAKFLKTDVYRKS